MRLATRRSSRPLGLATLVALAALAGCSKKPELPPTQVAAKDLPTYQAEIRKVVKDSSRAEQLVALTNEFQQLVVEVAARDKALLTEVAALNADFGATRAQYEALHQKARAERLAHISRLLALRAKMAAVTTNEEWDQLKKERLRMMQDETTALEI